MQSVDGPSDSNWPIAVRREVLPATTGSSMPSSLCCPYFVPCQSVQPTKSPNIFHAPHTCLTQTLSSDSQAISAVRHNQRVILASLMSLAVTDTLPSPQRCVSSLAVCTCECALRLASQAAVCSALHASYALHQVHISAVSVCDQITGSRTLLSKVAHT